MAHGMCTCVFWGFTVFQYTIFVTYCDSVIISKPKTFKTSNTVNINKYNSHKQKLFEVLSNLRFVKGS